MEEISEDIENLKIIISLMKNSLESIKEGKFENLNLNNTMKNFLDKYNALNYYFDITDNNPADFSKIKNIKLIFEQFLLPIKNEFKILCEKFDSDLGNISIDLSNKLDNIFINNFNLPLLPDENHHYVNYDELDTNSPLLSMPTISKKDGILKCNYKKMTFQKGPFCPDLYSKPIILLFPFP